MSTHVNYETETLMCNSKFQFLG